MKSETYNMDCMDYMRTCKDKQFDLAIVDPPYGINIENSGTWMKAHKLQGWDSSIPDEKYFFELFRVSKNQIIWGGNYFTNYLYPNNNWSSAPGDKANLSYF